MHGCDALRGLLHGVPQVKSDDAVAMAGRLATEEGLFCGISSGAAVAAAVQVGSGRKAAKGNQKQSASGGRG